MTRSGWRSILFISAICAVGVVLHRPALTAGYMLDDFLQNAMLDGSYAVPRSPLDLYTFVRPEEVKRLVDAGTLPWWSHPELRISAFRPLASALLWLDHRGLALSSFGRHVHSLLWWSALVFAFWRLVSRFIPAGAARIATFLFALHPAHVMPIAWLANRAELVSALFGVVAFAEYVDWRQRGARLSAFGCGAAFTLSLAAGEYGLCTLGYAASYELFVADGAVRKRLTALLPAALPAAVFLVVYTAFAYGPSTTSMYVSPLSAPLDFVKHSAVRLPSLLATEFFLLPSGFVSPVLSFQFGFVPGFVLWLLLLTGCLGASFLIRAAIASAPESGQARKLWCLLVGMLLALVPLLGTFPHTRLLVIPSIGMTAAVGFVIWEARQRLKSRSRPTRLAWVGLVTALIFGVWHLVGGPLHTAAESFANGYAQERVRQIAREAEIDDHNLGVRDLVVINTPDPPQLLYLPYIRNEQGRPRPRVFRTLAMTGWPIRVRRTAFDTLELSVQNGSLTQNAGAGVVRREDHPLRAGERVELSRATIDVLAAGPAGPRRLSVRFAGGLDESAIELVAYSVGSLKRLKLDVGREITVPGLLVPGG